MSMVSACVVRCSAARAGRPGDTDQREAGVRAALPLIPCTCVCVSVCVSVCVCRHLYDSTIKFQVQKSLREKNRRVMSSFTSKLSASLLG